TFLLRRQPQEALAYFTMALEKEPGSPETRYHAGLALMGLGRYEEAGRSFKAAAQLDPASAELLAHLGTALALQDKWGEAAAAYPEMGRFDEAQAAARQALELLKTAPADRTRPLEARLQLYREHKPFRMVSAE